MVYVIGEEYEEFKFIKESGIYKLTENANIILKLNVNNEIKYYKFIFKAGFKCDGLSVPTIFQWFLKSWDNKNMLYNLAGVVHDALYGNKGWNIFNREDSDSIFRGILRDARYK